MEKNGLNTIKKVSGHSYAIPYTVRKLPLLSSNPSMKKILLVVLAGLILTAGIMIYNFWQRHFLVDADYSKALALMKEELNKQPGHEKTYQYTYYNFWNLSCKPCIEEMPRLDSLAGLLSPEIRFVFVSNERQKDVERFLEKKRFPIRHFVFVNDMNYFMSAVRKKANNHLNAVPVHVITDASDEILFFRIGAFSKLHIDDLNIPEEDKKRFKERLKDPVIKKLEYLDSLLEENKHIAGNTP